MDGWLPIVAVAVCAAAGAWRLVRRHGRDRRLMLLCRRADLEYSAVDPFPDTLWLPFGWLDDGRWVRAEHVVWNRGGGDAVRAFDLVIEEPRASGDAPPRQRRVTCATATTGSGGPRLRIAPRDVVGTAADAVLGREIELELEAFNRRFRVTAEDRRYAVAFCDQRMMRALMALPHGVSVAANEDRLLLRASELPPAEVLLLHDAARAIARTVPAVVADLYPPRPSVGPHEARWLQGHWSPDPTGDDATATEAERR